MRGISASRVPARRRRHQVAPRRRWSLEFLEQRTLLAVQAVSLANPALYGASANGTSSVPSISGDGQLVAFQSDAGNLAAGATASVLAQGIGVNFDEIYVRDLTNGSTRLVSANASGVEGNGNSTDPVLSANGQFVVYYSQASNLTPVSSSDVINAHLYETNLQTGVTTLVDVNTAGQAAALGVPLVPASVSADGRYIAFLSNSTDLVSQPNLSQDTFAYTNVYVRDMVAGTTTLVSVNSTGTDGGNGDSSNESISADGSTVVYQSNASDLVAQDSNGSSDVFVYNLAAKTTSLVSANISNADSGDQGSYDPVISGNGTEVAFLSNADDLQSIPVLRHFVEVYVRNVTTDTTTLVSVNAAGDNGASGFEGFGLQTSLAISSDGSTIAWVDIAPDLTAFDPMNLGQVFVRNLAAGTTTMVSTNAAGTAASNAAASGVALSTNGSMVAFRSAATDLTAEPTSGAQNIYVYNLAMPGAPMLASINTGDTDGGDADSDGTTLQDIPLVYGAVALSADGTNVAFESAANNLVASDSNQLPDVFERNLAIATTVLVSARDPAQPAAFTTTGQSYLGGISADGTVVALNSDAGDLTGTTDEETGYEAAVVNTQTGAVFAPDAGSAADLGSGATVIDAAGSLIAYDDDRPSGQSNVYTAAVPGGTPVLASVNDAGTGPGDAASFSPILSADGSTVVFTSEATDLVPNFVRGQGQTVGIDLFARNLTTGVTSLVSINNAGTAAGDGLSGDFGSGDTGGDVLNGGPYTYSVSADGRYVAFTSAAIDLAPIAGQTGGDNIYVRDLQTGTTQLVDVADDGVSPANGYSTDAVISADGRYVAFLSTATNLVPGMTGSPGSSVYLYVRDLQTETTQLVSVDLNGFPTAVAGELAAGASFSMSSDGQVLAFLGGYTDSNNHFSLQVYVYSMATGTTQLASVNAAGDVADASPSLIDLYPATAHVVVSPNGQYVGFLSPADNLAPGTNWDSENLYVGNLATETTTLVSANLAGTGGGSVNAPSGGVDDFAFSADGSTVAFDSTQYDLVAGEDYPASNVFVVPLGSAAATTGSISGLVYDDADGNGQLDTGEPGLAGWTVFLDVAGTGTYAAGDPTATTNASGIYTFPNLAPGTYTVGNLVQAGFAQTAPPAPGTESVVVVAGQTATGPNFGDEPLPPDLTVQSISVPATAQPGQPASPLSYTVVNNGGGAANGDWQDAVYLSSTPTINASSTLLTVVPQSGGLAPGASYTVPLTSIPLPLLPVGNEYLIVQVDRRGQVAESAAVKGDETQASNTPIALTIPTLEVGTPATGSFTAAGQDQLYAVTVAAGQNLLLTLASAASSGALSLSAQFATLPVPGQAGTLVASSFTPNEQLAIAPTQTGTYLIDVHSQSGAAATAGFTLTATTPGLALLRAPAGSVGNGGTATIEIDGLGFTPATAFTLMGPGGAIPAQAIQFVDGSQVFATFNTMGQPVGSYGIQAAGAGGTGRIPEQRAHRAAEHRGPDRDERRRPGPDPRGPRLFVRGHLQEHE